jgi:hypothetical protein
MYSDWAIAIVLNNNVGYPYDAKVWVRALWNFYMIGKRLNMVVLWELFECFLFFPFFPGFWAQFGQRAGKDLYQANCVSFGSKLPCQIYALVYCDYMSWSLSYDQATKAKAKSLTRWMSSSLLSLCQTNSKRLVIWSLAKNHSERVPFTHTSQTILVAPRLDVMELVSAAFRACSPTHTHLLPRTSPSPTRSYFVLVASHAEYKARRLYYLVISSRLSYDSLFLINFFLRLITNSSVLLTSRLLL